MSETLLVGIDGSEGSRRAAQCAASLARLSGARLVVAYVIDWSPYSFLTPEELDMRHKKRQEEIDRAQQEIVEPMLEQLRTGGLSVEAIVRHGHASKVLRQLAQETAATHLFVGRRGVSKLSDLLFGSVVSSLVQISPIPVTVVP